MKLHALAVVGIVGVALWPLGAQAAAVDLGTAAAFGVLGASTVTNTGSSVIGGDVGVSPGTAITGFPPGSFTGTEHAGDAVAAAAQADALAAYNVAAGLASTDNLTGQDLGGLTLTPGVYTFSSSAQLTGTLTLNGEGNPNAVWIFQTGSTLVTGSASKVVLENGAQPCNVYWQIGSSATLGTGSTFVGTVMALTSITVTTDVTVAGRTLARNGAVTLDTDTIAPQACGASVTPPPIVVPKAPVTKGGTPAKPVVVVVKLPAPGCGCVTPPRKTTGTPIAWYVVIGKSKHCHVTINQTTGKLRFRADKGYYGRFTVIVQHGMTVTVCHFTVLRTAAKKPKSTCVMT